MAPKNHWDPTDPSRLATAQLDREIAGLRDLQDERDRRYEQRFEAQEVAVAAALRAQQTAVEAALDAAKEAVLKAEAASDKRFESVNEFRGQLRDQATGLMPRTEYTVQHKALENRVETVHKELATSFSAATGNLNEKVERMRAEAVDRADVLRHEASDKIAQNFKESTARIDSLGVRLDAKVEEIDRRLLAIETKQAETVGQTTGVDRSVLVEERARTRRMQTFAAIGIGTGVIGGILGVVSQLK